MQLKYGTYAFDANAVKLQTASRVNWNDGGQPMSITKSIAVDGYLTATGQAANSTAMSALATALATPYKDLYFYHDDATLSATALPNATSIGGVHIVDGPNFPDSIGAEFVNFRRFTFTAEAEYPITNTNNLLLSFRERLSFSGGGPIYAHRMAVNGLPQKQLVYPFSIFKTLQEGEAVGYRRYPTPPRPIWPSALIVSPNITEESPKRRGKLAGQAGYEGYPVSWQYSFESSTQLVGVPNLWL
jgi:hypothetical protein